MDRPLTLGQLKKSGFRVRPVKDELRENLIQKLRNHEPLFPGILGYEDTVVPQLVHAILSRHDILFLGLRGQAKTRILRMLPDLLDEFTPTIDGCEMLDDPFEPRWTEPRRIVSERGDNAPIRWVHRGERFNEKLATPDVTIADLLGEIDLIKHAEGRYLSDESVMHLGLVPRTNRGIFALNELPDLAPRIQVGLFNVLEERDVQIRGFPIRLPLDIFIVFTANPEDYTNRGRIVTPLKDRIGSVIRTHYPRRREDALAITSENAWLERTNGTLKIEIPKFMMEIVEEVSDLARKSPHINQQSGVSVRTSITNAENMVSSAERRAILLGEERVVPRICDLHYLAASCRGKIELMLAEDEDAEDKLVTALLGEAVKNVFARYHEIDSLDQIVQHFQSQKTNLEVGDDCSNRKFVETLEKYGCLKKAAVKLCVAADLDFNDPALLASAGEFVLEALHVNDRLSKYAYQGRTFYKR